MVVLQVLAVLVVVEHTTRNLLAQVQPDKEMLVVQVPIVDQDMVLEVVAVHLLLALAAAQQVVVMVVLVVIGSHLELFTLAVAAVVLLIVTRHLLVVLA